MNNQGPKPALVLAVNWLAGNTEPVELAAGADRLVLHLEALKDLEIRSVRFHFVDGFLLEPTPEMGGPRAVCLVGECGPLTGGGRPARVEGLTRPVARRTLKARERIPHSPTGSGTGRVIDQFTDGIEFWKWEAGLLARQPIGGPNDVWQAAVTMHVPQGACLGFAVTGLSRPCRLVVQVGGK